jgi:hypothetical protein
MRTKERLLASCALLATTALSTACPHAPSPRKGTVNTRLSGTAYLSHALSARTINLVDEQAMSPTAIASTTSDAAGAWNVDLGPISGSVRGEVVLEGASGPRVESAIVDALELGTTRSNVEVSPVTHLTATLAHALVARGEPSDAALSKARKLFHEHFGGVDHATTDPIDVSAAPVAMLSDGALIGILLAGFEEQASLLAASGSAADADVGVSGLVERYAEDIQDGVFDGRGPSGQVVFAGMPLSADSLRADYAHAVATFLDGPRNMTSFRSSDLSSVLEAIRTNQSALFPEGSGASTPMPVIHAQLLRPDLSVVRLDRPVSGHVYLDIQVADHIAISSIRAAASSTAGVGADLFGQGSEARFPLDTGQMKDGAQRLRIDATDARGTTTSTAIAFVVDNTPPVVTLSAPSQVPTATLAVSGTWADAVGPVDVLLTVGSQAVRLHTPPSSFSTVVAIPCGSDVLIQAIALDAAGNTSIPAFAHTRCSSDQLAISFGLSTMIQERDLVMSRASGHLVFDIPPNARSATISEAASASTIHLEKLFTRLDASSDNVPLVRVVVTGPVATLEYRYVVNGREVRTWSPLPAASEVAFPISYDRLGLDLVLAPVGALHHLEFRARDMFGRERVRALEFALDVLSPPLWIDSCAPAANIAWSQLGPAFVGGQDIAIGGGSLQYLLDLPTTSGSPSDGLDLQILPVHARSDIAELSEQKFFAPAYVAWDVWTQGSPPNIQCNFNATQTGYQAFELWTGAQVCGLGANYPDDQVFYSTATQGAINDPSASASRIAIYDGVAELGSGSASAAIVRIPAEHALTFQASAAGPVLLIHHAPYSWTTTYEAVPSGDITVVNTTGRYRIAAPYRHDGYDVSIPDFGSGQILVRAFTTRAAIHKFRLTNDPPVFMASHARIPGLVAPVATSSVCQQPIIEELSE